MSVTPTNEDVADYEATGRTDFDENGELFLDALPERFDEHSHKYHAGTQVIVIPSHPHINSDGKTCDHLLMGKIHAIAEHYGFKPGMVTVGNEGVGLRFWYKYRPDEL